MSKWLTKKLQSSLEARSTDPVKAYEELGDGILKFESLNILPVPMEVGELSGGEALGISLLNHSAKFYKTCQLKFGNEKLEKEIKWHKKQDNFGTLEMHSTLKGISWSYGFTQSSLCPVSISIFFFYPDDSASGALSENSWTGHMNLFRTAGFPVFQFLWNFND